MDEIKDGDSPSPFTDFNTSFWYINGNLSSGTFESLMLAFKERGYDVDGIYNPANPSNVPNKIEGDEDRVPLFDADGDQLQYPPCSGGSGNCNGDLRYAHEWPTTVVVYDSDTCTPNKDLKVAGFVNVVIYDVGQPGDKSVKARILCDYVEPDSRGGGGNYGTFGSIPGLVQ